MPRWLVALVLASISAASAALAAVIASAEPATGPARPGLTTPLLSPRRTPELLTSTLATVRLSARLDAAMTDPALGGARDASCLVVESKDELVYARRATTSLIPASNMKILTGMAALTRLGGDSRFVTEVRAVGRPRGGVVDGEVWLVGSGDPLLGTADYAATFRNQPQVFTPLEDLADSIVANGVRHIRGGVVGDESRFDTERYVASWRPQYVTDHEVAAASALVVNDAFVQFPPARRVQTEDPARHAAEVLTGLLRARNVVVDRPPTTGAAPGRAVSVGSVSSAPVADIVGEMIRESDNLTAELLVKELGRRFGDGGTWREGLEVMEATLASRGLSVDGVEAVDGSGLSRLDRLSCDVLMNAMEIVGPDSKVARSFPVAGETGTLADRFKGSPAAGRIRAKTGSLAGVIGLTGYADGNGGALIAFSLLANDLPRDAVGRALQERVGAALVSYPDAPRVQEIAPLPPAKVGEAGGRASGRK